MKKKQAEEKIDSGAARRELESAVGYNCAGQCPDDTVWVIQGILVGEIKRLRRENAQLSYLVSNYLTVLDQEKSQAGPKA